MALEQQIQAELPLKQRKIQYRFLPQIMIIDDDHELLEELKDSLSFDYEVETLFNSANAFEIACELKPDLIIMDMKMFPKTGFQLAYEFKNSLETKFIPIIAITGVFIEKEHTLMMKLSGMKRILIKPFILSNLLAEIEAALKESKSYWA
jgi:DNA-binding response OmpR family regulator